MCWSAVEFYDDFVEKQGDPRTNIYVLIKTPIFTLFMVFSYIFFACYAGPKYMKHRKPFDLRKYVILYNFLHVSLTVYLLYWSSTTAWFSKYENWFCVPLDFNDDSPETLEIVNISWWFFISRFVEFIDTIFFVLRKKNNQLSALHLVHHVSVPIITWIGMKFCPIGQSTFAGYINAYVHVVMYTYYMFSAMGPEVRKYLWWKKYLTVLQLVQFVIVMTHTLVVINTECPGPKWFSYLLLIQAIAFFCMFLHFYIKEYTITTNSEPFFIQNWINKIPIIYNKIVQCKAIFEACIPNQSVLLENSIDDEFEDPGTSQELNTKQKIS